MLMEMWVVLRSLLHSQSCSRGVTVFENPIKEQRFCYSFVVSWSPPPHKQNKLNYRRLFKFTGSFAFHPPILIFLQYFGSLFHFQSNNFVVEPWWATSISLCIFLLGLCFLSITDTNEVKLDKNDRLDKVQQQKLPSFLVFFVNFNLKPLQSSTFTFCIFFCLV